ncbi:uncharacterized protein LOC108001452 [Apis cerana]|uniref:uncharacterized protein LOC108001452 n=1 Tax=Apis cerana TaxID=7461 RepID=UPI002B23163B|nr:uncharacterized protein LOC108001452 [Apis cerana]
MCWKAIVIFLILLCIIVYNYDNLTKVYPSINNYISNELPELTTLSPALEKSNDNFMTSDDKGRRRGNKEEKDGERYKSKNVILQGDNMDSRLCRREISTSFVNVPFDSTKVGKILSRLIKKETRDNYFKVKRSIATKLRKKANVLGRLLINSVSNKSDEYDYDNLDDDHLKDADNDEINWDNEFLNENGPSIMELIVLNEKHRKKLYPNLSPHDDEYY